MKKKKKNIVVIALALLIVLLALGVLIGVGNKTANSQPERIYLPDGTTHEALVDTLRAHRIIGEGLEYKIFNIQCSIFNSKIHAGSYVVEPRMKTLTLLRRLRNGQQSPIRLTIGKFRTPQQLNEFLNRKLMHNDFNIPLDRFHIVRPNTYEFYWTVTPGQFMERMEKEYHSFWSTRSAKEYKEYKTNAAQEIIVLASIVEEETNNNAEKPLIASVYLNRLKRGIPLQADPTVKYSLGDFSLQRILNRHLAVESPFNTYLHTGLPPAPICLPSNASVDAVLNAPETNYIYFCASDKMDGTHCFATTLAEHNRNAAAFHRALNARGIK